MAIDWSSKLAGHLSLDAKATSVWGDLLAGIGRGVQSEMERAIGRHLEPHDHVEAYNGRGLGFLWLRWDPVISVSGVQLFGDTDLTLGVDGAPVYPPPQVVLENSVMLSRTDGLPFPDVHGATIVRYRAGFQVCPPALITAGVLWGAVIFKNRDRSGISSQSMGTQSVTFTDAMPAFVKDVLQKWERVAGRS
jgi:hypothetical protein